MTLPFDGLLTVAQGERQRIRDRKRFHQRGRFGTLRLHRRMHPCAGHFKRRVSMTFPTCLRIRCIHRLILSYALANALWSVAPVWAGWEEGFLAYEQGDYATALKEMRPLAEQGNAIAQYSLGVMYHNGEGVAKDFREAERWYRRAAEQGYDLGQFHLAKLYLQGNGVAQDYTEAAKWLTSAAEHGNGLAQTRLGEMYLTGEGITRNDVLAYTWLSLAAAQGQKKAIDLKDGLAGRMTPIQIAEAQRLIVQLKSKRE